MSQDLLIPIVIAILAGIFLYKNVNVAVYRAQVEDYDDFEFFKQYSTIVETYLEEIIQDITSTTPQKYVLKHNSDEKYLLDFLKDQKRTLNFYQTELSKSQTKEQISDNLFQMLSKIDDEVTNRFENGSNLALELKNSLEKEYQKLQP